MYLAFNIEECFNQMSECGKGKDIVIFSRRHWVSFLGDIIISVLLLIIPLVIIIVAFRFLPGTFHGKILNFMVVFGSAYYLVMLTLIFSAWISYYYDIYILTSDTIVDITQSGFFNRKISQLSLLRVQDVSSKVEGFFHTFFTYGDVLVETAGEKVETFLLKDIPNPQKFSAKVLEMHDELIARESREGQVSEGEGLLVPHKSVVSTPIESKPEPEPQSQPQDNQPQYVPEKPVEQNEGEVSKDELNQGGEVKL